MSKAGRFALRLLLAGTLAGGAYLGWVSLAGSPAPVDLLPAGAAFVVEVHGAEELAERVAGTRLAAAFAKSATRDWLESTEAVRSFDALLADIRRVTGLSPGRSSAFDLIGNAAAVGWYPANPGSAEPGPWIAGGRLSLRAWATAAALRAGRKLGLGATIVDREVVAGGVVHAIRADAGQPLHLFLAGRVLVASPDRSLVLRAVRGGGDASLSVTGEPGWRSIRGVLPEGGDLFVWVRSRGLLPGASVAGTTVDTGVGAVLRAGKTVEIDGAAEPARSPTEAAPVPLPGLSLLRSSPLLFFASRDPVPSAVADLLQTRLRAVARQQPAPASPGAGIRPARGFALAITDSAGGSGLFPAPRGLLVIGMGSAEEAARSLPLLFPRGSRTAAAGGTRAFATRESFPLAGEFELWGAAVGPRLVFATDTTLIDAAAADTGEGKAVDPPVPEPGWQVRAVAAISMEKALPLLQRWAAPLSGLMAARWPTAPDVSRDIDLLAALGTVRVAAGSDGRRDRVAITLRLRDLP